MINPHDTGLGNQTWATLVREGWASTLDAVPGGGGGEEASTLNVVPSLLLPAVDLLTCLLRILTYFLSNLLETICTCSRNQITELTNTNRGQYPKVQRPVVTGVFFFSSVHPVVYAVNLFCILLFIFDLVVHIIFLTWPVFWSRSAEGGWWNG